MDTLMNGLAGLGVIGAIIFAAITAFYAYMFSVEKKKSNAKAEDERKKTWDEYRAWKAKQDQRQG